MEKNIKNYIVIGVFALIIFGLALLQILPDAENSRAERRRLAQMPEFSLEAVFSGEYMEDLEEYLLDQFPARDAFRTVNAVLKTWVLGQRDNGGVYLHDGGIYKTEYPLDEKQALMGADKIDSIASQYLGGLNVYYSIIPDKSYFAADEAGRPALDYDRLVSIVNGNVENAEYINIFGTLSIDDYYRTDTHWRQERIFPVAEALAEGMGISEYLTPFEEYTARELYPFYGVYLGQSALPVEPDTIVYLESAATRSAVVTGAEFEGERGVYEEEHFQNLDGYDVFLSGAQALLTIECPDAETERELYIFRDSFGSSIIPYFTGAYSKITVIDLRYLNSAFLGQLMSFTEGADALFLYSTSVLNNAAILR